jgi:uncharacterized membrane protein
MYWFLRIVMATATAPAVTSRSSAKIMFFVVFFAMTAIAVYDKDARVFNATSAIAQHFAPAKWYVLVHGFFGAIAMGVAAFQFSNRMRARYLRVHRVLGYAYVTSVIISAPLAAMVALKLSRSLSQFVANCVNSSGWVVTTAIALYCIRTGNIVQHRRWMIRSYPWAMAFTFNRFAHVLLPATRAGHPGFEATLWLSSALAAFLPNILLEWRSIFPSHTRTTAARARMRDDEQQLRAERLTSNMSSISNP